MDMNVHQPRSELSYDEVDPYEMGNLYPRETGLLASVSVRPIPELVAGSLANADLKAVQAWVVLNSEALIGYWDGELGTVEFVQALKKV